MLEASAGGAIEHQAAATNGFFFIPLPSRSRADATMDMQFERGPMTILRSLRLAATAICALLGSLVVSAGIAAADPMPKDTAELDAYLHDYIMKNPGVVRDALAKLESDEQSEQTKTALLGFKDEIYHAGSPEIGSKDAKVTIVEFYDYNCPYCRSSYPKLKAFLKANPDTKLLLKDTTSFGKDSEAVGRIAFASLDQGKFAELHDALMTQKGPLNEARALAIAKTLGIDIERLKADAASTKVIDALKQAQDLANRLNVSTTPLYIIGHFGIAGLPDDFETQLAAHVAEIRKSGCAACGD